MISPPLRWSDLPGRRVGVWGAGAEGRATLRRLGRLGVQPSVVVDDNPAEPWIVATSPGGMELLSRCDVVIKSPGISRYGEKSMALEAGGVAVVGGMGLWLEEVGSGRVIGITGTKGKSTTTSVAAHLAAGMGRTCFVGGNLGTAPWDPEPQAGLPGDTPEPDLWPDPDLWIVEISSYQATDLWSSPAVVAVTSLHPDHLDWHGSLDAYYSDKLSLCGRPGARITVANGTDERLRQRAGSLAPGPRWVLPPDGEGDGDGGGAGGGDWGGAGGGDWGGAGGGGPSSHAEWVGRLGLRGRHNIVNALIAATCLEEMGISEASDPDRLAEAASGFQPLPHRLQTVAVIGGVEYVDDSLSTNVLPTIAAAEVFADRPLALIAGGFDRDIDYRPLALHLAGRDEPSLVLTVPDNGERIRREVGACGVDVVACDDIEHAVLAASRWAIPGAVVLLSPAAASYGRFNDYRHRGGVFRAAVEALREATS